MTQISIPKQWVISGKSSLPLQSFIDIVNQFNFSLLFLQLLTKHSTNKTNKKIKVCKLHSKAIIYRLETFPQEEIQCINLNIIQKIKQKGDVNLLDKTTV